MKKVDWRRRPRALRKKVCAEEVVAAADTEGVTQRWEGCTGG